MNFLNALSTDKHEPGAFHITKESHMPVALSGMITSTFCHIGKEDLEKSPYVFFNVLVVFIYSSDSSLTGVSSQNSTELILVDDESLMQNLPNLQGRKHSL